MKIKTYIKKLYEIANVEDADLKGLDSLTSEEYELMIDLQKGIIWAVSELLKNDKLKSDWNS